MNGNRVLEWRKNVKAGLRQIHARLLSTKLEVLPSWKQTFNSYERFSTEENDPFGIIYNYLLDATMKKTTVDYELLTKHCESQCIVKAQAESIRSGLLRESETTEATLAQGVETDIEQVDLWFNEHLVDMNL